MPLITHRLSILLSVLLLAGCATSTPSPDNPPLIPLEGQRPLTNASVPNSGGVLLVVTFSGGGNRAAAFTYGVLEGLQKTPLPPWYSRDTMVEEVDMISAVSGGSITAAYYGLNGSKTFTDFRSDYLDKNTSEGIKSLMLSPSSLSRLSSESFGSGDILDEYFQQQLFGNAKLSELVDNHGPHVQINATDLFKGGRFAFTAEQFAFICSDASQFPISRAVAASSGVPVVFSPITLKNRAGQCNYPTPDWIKIGLQESDTNPRRHRLARYQGLYLDSENHPYLHLLDGGLADNLGLRAVMDRIIIEGGLWQTLKRFNQHSVRHIAIITVDASALPPAQWEKTADDPPTAVVLDAATTAPLANYNFETLEYLRSHVPEWLQEVVVGRCITMNNCEKPNLYLVDLSLEDVNDVVLMKRLTSISTDFSLPAGAADELIDAGQKLLKSHPEFVRLLRAIEVDRP